jgi:hypothetical protein
MTPEQKDKWDKFHTFLKQSAIVVLVSGAFGASLATCQILHEHQHGPTAQTGLHVEEGHK